MGGKLVSLKSSYLDAEFFSEDHWKFDHLKVEHYHFNPDEWEFVKCDPITGLEKQ